MRSARCGNLRRLTQVGRPSRIAGGPRSDSSGVAWEPQRERCRGRPMTMTDPIADFLTRLRNANTAYHDEVKLPHSKIKANIAEILKREGYISDFRTEDAEIGSTSCRERECRYV